MVSVVAMEPILEVKILASASAQDAVVGPAPVLVQGSDVSNVALLNRRKCRLSTWSLDPGSQLENIDDPNTPFGFKNVIAPVEGSVTVLPAANSAACCRVNCPVRTSSLRPWPSTLRPSNILSSVGIPFGVTLRLSGTDIVHTTD